MPHGLNFLQTSTWWYTRKPWKNAALGDGSDDGSIIDLSLAIVLMYFSLRKFVNEEPYNKGIVQTVTLPIESGEAMSAYNLPAESRSSATFLNFPKI